MKCPKVLLEPILETRNIGQQHKNTRKIGVTKICRMWQYLLDIYKPK